MAKQEPNGSSGKKLDALVRALRANNAAAALRHFSGLCRVQGSEPVARMMLEKRCSGKDRGLPAVLEQMIADSRPSAPVAAAADPAPSSVVQTHNPRARRRAS